MRVSCARSRPEGPCVERSDPRLVPRTAARAGPNGVLPFGSRGLELAPDLKVHVAEGGRHGVAVDAYQPQLDVGLRGGLNRHPRGRLEGVAVVEDADRWAGRAVEGHPGRAVEVLGPKRTC